MKIGRSKRFVVLYNKKMITLYTYKEFYACKVTDKLPLQCEFCQKEFHIIKRRIQSALRKNGKDKCNFCSKSCASKAKKQIIEFTCPVCNNMFTKAKSMIRDNKVYCCSKSCAAKNRKSD